MAKILIGCENSQIITEQFALLGHFVLSCDLLPAEKEYPHCTGDVRQLLDIDFDLGIFFPPCTYLAKVSSVRRAENPKRVAYQQESVDFVLELFHSSIPRVVIENPVGFLSTVWRKPEVITSPHLYGDTYRKEICLWHKNLIPLPRFAPEYGHLNKRSLSPGMFKSVSNHVNGRMSSTEKNRIKSSWKYFPRFAEAFALHYHNQLINS